MNQSNETLDIKIVYVLPHLAGQHLDYSLGEEAPLFSPPKGARLVYGKGYNSWKRRKTLGMPYHKTRTRAHKRWLNMLQRCYTLEKVAYFGCSVCPKWLDFQEFADWFEVQPYAGAVDAELDKDILDSQNLVYSPEHCTVVPKRVNLLFKDSRKLRGRLPKGIYEHSSKLGFVARISREGKSVELGRFESIAGAFEVYKQARQEYGKELAALFDGHIDPRVTERLRNLSAHIRD